MTVELADATAREDWGPQRSRTVTWHEPGPSTAKGMTMTGIEYLRAMAGGELPQPPIAGLLRFDITSADPGRVVFTCEPDESAYNPIGAVHGGLVCTLLDSVTGCAIHSTLPQGKGYTSVEIKVNYNRYATTPRSTACTPTGSRPTSAPSRRLRRVPAESFSPLSVFSTNRRTNGAAAISLGCSPRAISQECSPRGRGNQPGAIGVVRVEPNQQKIVKLLSALIAASAIVVMAVLAVTLKEEQAGTGTGTMATEANGQMTFGGTATTTTPPQALPIPVAKPTMKAAVPKGFR